MKWHQPRIENGFTLVEVLVVSAILGILAMTAVSASSKSGEFRLNLIQTQVDDAVSYAKALARSTRQAHGVVFDPTAERLAVVDEDGNIAIDPLTKGDYIVDFTRASQSAGIDITSADFGSTGSAFIVQPEGTGMAAGTVVLSFDGLTRTLTADLANGTLVRL